MLLYTIIIMVTQESYKNFVLEQAAGAGELDVKSMFGVYCLYCDGKSVAFICEDAVLVKETDAGRAYIGEVVERELFPGSNLWFAIEDRVDDRDWFSGLIRLTASTLPPPKNRKPRSGGKKKYLIN
jgi:TfoX/Sxy family transcriptional regulator of competence genes